MMAIKALREEPAGVTPPGFTHFPTPPQISDKAARQHADLAKYLHDRLVEVSVTRTSRLRRYGFIDRSISTWQQLGKDDMQRAALEEQSGRVVGYPVSLPLMATHLDDTVAFFSEIFAPSARNFFSVPDGSGESGSIAAMAKRLNRDSKYNNYYQQVARVFRSLIKYNLSGLSVEWRQASATRIGGNKFTAIDPYNTLWDPAVVDVTEVARRAEWVDQVDPITRRELMGGLQDQTFIADRVKRLLSPSRGEKNEWSRLYVNPGPYAIPAIDSQSSTSNSAQTVEWAQFGLGSSLDAHTTGLPKNAFERHRFYIWIDPSDFGLARREQKKYELWHITVVDGIVIQADQAVTEGEMEPNEVIPVFLAPYTDDNVGELQRSTMEYMRGFQRFSSFMMNIWVRASRKSVYGITYYDPNMLDVSKIDEGQVAGYVPLSTTGRDVRTGIWKDTNSAAADNVIQMLLSSLNLTKEFFPNQALPAQIAGIDRAVKDQVSAVLAGGQARLRMQARVIDATLFRRGHQQAVRNLLRNEPSEYPGLTEEQISAVLGSGLKSVTAERAQMAFRELVGVLGILGERANELDIVGFLNAFSESMNLDFRLGDYFQQQAPPVAAGGSQPAESAQPVPPVQPVQPV